MNKNISGKTVVITGASSGIGEATARLLARSGAHVVMAARRTERLEAIAAELEAEGCTVYFRQADVTKLVDMQAVVDFTCRQFGRLDVVVNNAGVMPLSLLESLKLEEWNQMIDVNIRGVLHGIAAALPIMKEQGNGQFINIASIGAYEVSPTAAVYCATKFAVRAITEGLRLENVSGIRATLISPGVTESELANSISEEYAKELMKEYRKQALPAEAIARTILFAIEQPADTAINELVVRPS
ncbi:oxidoreductase [Paenibacillus sp. FSL H7-0357]|uniref:SDR family oxidoreductase n=1 Tax=Paenibacillus sp. FSL H7-0357 TaxID=1536774 RepID=UPI0004F61126|nr:oxidoreductase [Paenibacillus sp. FSL H7-0357]